MISMLNCKELETEVERDVNDYSRVAPIYFIYGFVYVCYLRRVVG